MYDELVKRLRKATGWKNASEHYSLMKEAADAIEELSMRLHGDEAAIAGMKREIERMVVSGSKPRWIPVAERLPEVRTWVLCYCRANSFDVFRMTDEGNWQYGNRSIYMKGYVTHWMPLPPAPKEESYGV